MDMDIKGTIKPLTLNDLNDDGVHNISVEILLTCISDLKDCYRIYERIIQGKQKEEGMLSFLGNVRYYDLEHLQKILDSVINECFQYLKNGYSEYDTEYLIPELHYKYQSKYKKGYELWQSRQNITHSTKQTLSQ